MTGPRQRAAAIDPYSSAISFAGWQDREAPFVWPRGYQPLPVAVARTWMLTTGWWRHGAVDVREVPGPAG